MAAYVIINKDNLQASSEQVQKTRELVEETRALNDEYAKAKDERKQSSEGYAAQASAASKLVAELGELRSKTSLTTDEQTRMKMVVAELNQLVPELNLVYDEQNNIFNKTQTEIEGCVDAYMALYKAQAAQEELQAIAQQQVEYEKQLYELGKQREELLDDLNQKESEYNEILKELTRTADAHSAAATDEYAAILEAKIALEEFDSVIKETTDNNTALTEEYKYWIDVIEENQPIYDAAAAEGTLGEEAQAAATSIDVLETTVSQAFSDMYDSVFESVNNQISLFSEFKGEAELTTKDLLSNMQSQVDGITQWADNMEQLAERGIDQGLLKHLADLGPEGAGYVATFVEMSDEELQKANDLFEQSLMLSDETATKVAKSYETAGKKSAGSFATGISDSSEDVTEASGDMAQASIDETNKVLGSSESGYSKEFETIGEGVDTGMAAGIKGSMQDVLDTVEMICSKMLSTGQQCVTQSDWQEIGRRIPEGMKSGIEAGAADVMAAVEDLVSKALEAAQRIKSISTLSSPVGYSVVALEAGEIVGWQPVANIGEMITASLPDANMITEKAPAAGITPAVKKNYEISQEINIYTLEDDPIEAARRFRDAQREAAEAW